MYIPNLIIYDNYLEIEMIKYTSKTTKTIKKFINKDSNNNYIVIDDIKHSFTHHQNKLIIDYALPFSSIVLTYEGVDYDLKANI